MAPSRKNQNDCAFSSNLQKLPSTGVLMKKCSKNMLQIYK